MKAVVELLEAESGCRDRGFRVTGRLAAAQRSGPEEPVDRTLNDAEGGVGRADVLEEAKLPVRPEHPTKLVQGCLRVRDAAEKPHHDRGVEGALLSRKRRGVAVGDVDLDVRRLGPLARRLARGGIRLDRQHPLHLGRVVLERSTVTGANVDHAPA